MVRQWVMFGFEEWCESVSANPVPFWRGAANSWAATVGRCPKALHAMEHRRQKRKVITSNVEDPLVDKMLEAWDPTGTQAGVGQRSGYLGGYRGELPAANGRSGPVLTCVDLRRLVQWVAPCVGLQRNRQQERIRPRAIQASPLLTHPTLWNFHL